MGACGTCTLIFFILCNVIICLIGIPLVVFGALSFIWREWFWQHVDHLTDHTDDQRNLLRSQWENIGIILIVVGGVCVIVSWIGCAAAGLRSRGLLGCYLVILFAAFGVSLAFGIIVVYAWITEADKATIEEKFKTFQFYGAAGNLTTIGLDWNDIQIKYKCCGVNGPDDYKDSKLKENGLRVLPSCCNLDWSSYNLSLSEVKAKNDAAWTQCKNEAENKDSERKILFTKGCVMPELVIIIFGMLFGFAGFMFFTFLVGMCFCCCIRQDDDLIV